MQKYHLSKIISYVNGFSYISRCCLIKLIKFVTIKFFNGILVLWGVITCIFFLFNILPGDPATIILGQRASEQNVKAIHKDLGTDRPLLTQYLHYINDLSFISIHKPYDRESLIYLNPSKYRWIPLFEIGNKYAFVLKIPFLRKSYISKRDVSEILIDTLPETAILAFFAICIASTIGIILGIFAALYKDSWYDKGSFIFATIFGMSAPSYLVGLLVSWLFGYILADYTGLSPVGSLYDYDEWEGEYISFKNLILPAFTLGVRPLSIVIQLMRSSMLDVMSQDYIRTAKAKGLSTFQIVVRHALKNALNPVVTAISGWFAGLMAGAVFVEKVFNWKGIGFEVVDALSKNDLPVVMGATLFFASIFVIINTIVDIVYGFLDPRVRIK